MRYGAIAQLGERFAGSEEVRGSSPLGSTIFLLTYIVHRSGTGLRMAQTLKSPFAHTADACMCLVRHPCVRKKRQGLRCLRFAIQGKRLALIDYLRAVCRGKFT